MKSLTGKFITFEGPDGAGKTSILNKLVEKVQQKLVQNLVVTREPGGTAIAEAVRNVLLDNSNTNMDARTEALLFAAARRQHIVEIIAPALAQNKVIFCDRFVDSSVAYQGAGRAIGMDEVYNMNLFATNGLTPDLTLYFDVPSEVGLERIKNYRTDEINRLDTDTLEFHKRVNAGYQKLIKDHSKRIVIINANQPFADVLQAAYQVIANYLELN